MSAADVEIPKSGVKGRRVPGRPGRFDPSMPMHMTTRRRAKTGVPNGTPSIDGSTEDDQSRRGSPDDARPETSYSQPSQASPETAQLAGAANLATTPIRQSSSPHLVVPHETTEGAPESPLPVLLFQSPSRKRKRESASPTLTPNGVPTTPINARSLRPQKIFHQQPEEEDAVEVIDASQLSDREESYDDEDSGSDDRPNDSIALAVASLDVTPASSNDGSPASSVSQTGEESHGKKPLDDTVDVIMADAAEEVPLEIADLDEADDVDDQVRSEDDNRPTRKFGGKRRRAAHHLDGVEVRMRRQLETKKAFRVIARELKVVLAEISQRTLDAVMVSPESCVKAAEYQTVKTGLDAALEQRQTTIRAQHKFDLDLLKTTLQSQQQVRKGACQAVFQNEQDLALDRLQHDILTVARDAQLHEHEGSNATDDEDDVVPRPKQAAYRFKRGDVLGPDYESRSRLGLETEYLVDNLHHRFLMRKMLQDLPKDHEDVVQPPFAIMDSTTRDATAARGEEATSIGLLAAAASEAERIASIPKLRNEDAIGLQILGELCTRPSITHSAKEATEPTIERNAAIQRTPPQPTPPSMMSPPMNPTIAVEISPRAQQIFRERYEATMPPPQTPRQAEATFGSPFATLPGQHTWVSSTMHQERPNGLPTIAARLLESERHPEQSPKRSPMLTRHDRTSQDGPRSPEMYRREGLPSSPHGQKFGYDPVQAATGFPDRRAKSVDEKAPFDFLHRTPTLLERTNAIRETPILSQRPNAIQSPAVGRMDEHKRPESRNSEPRWPMLHNRPSASDRRPSPDATDRFSMHDQPPLADTCPSMGLAAPRPPRPRMASVSIKDEQRSEGSQAGDKSTTADGRSRNRAEWQKKTNIAERGGESRRAKSRRKKEFEKMNRVQPTATVKDAGSSHPHAGPFTPTTGGQGVFSRPWDVPLPQQSSTQSRPPPIMPPSAFSLYYGGPPRTHGSSLSHEVNEYEHQQQPHRNSFPPLNATPPGWNGPPPPSPVYAIPQQPQISFQPPPPGVDQYQPRPHPPPPLFHQQQSPMTPQPLSAPGNYGSQYGGPAIAPAMPDPRQQFPGFRPGPHNHPPAFAQQRSHEGQRRRTQSENHLRSSSWRSYEPAGRR